MTKQKILFILPSLSAGGAENYALRFIKHYQSRFEFHVLSVHLQKGDLHDAFEQQDIFIHYQSVGYFNLKKARNFFTLLKKHKYNTIVTFTGNFGGLPLTLAKYAGIKNRIAFHRRSTNAFGRNFLKLTYNKIVNLLLRKNATSILSNSVTAFKNFHGNVYQNNPKYKIIKNGVNAADFNIETSKMEARAALDFPKDVFIIGHVGRYDVSKNHQTMFKVIQRLKEQNRSFRFVFCGKRTDADPFMNQLTEHNIQDVVIPLGLRNDLPLIYRSLDVFYFPSITEGQPNALIEAMISGLPVLTSAIEPILDSLPASGKDLTIPPTAISEAAKQLSIFMDNPIQSKAYIHQDWAIKNFDLETNFNDFKTLLTHE